MWEKISNRQLQRVIFKELFAHVCFRNTGFCLPFRLPARRGNWEPRNRDKFSLVGPPSPFSSLSKNLSEPIGGTGPFPQMFECISMSFPLLEYCHHVSLLGRVFPVCKGPINVQPPVRDVLMAVLLEEHHHCSLARSHNLLHGRPQHPVGSQGALMEWKCSLNPAYLARRFAEKEPSAPSSCTDGLTHWTQDSHLDVSLKDGCKPRSLSILSLICYKDSFPYKNLLSFSHLREHLSLSKHSNGSRVNPVPCSF